MYCIGKKCVSILKSKRMCFFRKSCHDVKYILGIETSCDDTAVAVIDSNGNVLSDVISSQWELHAKYKGIHPFFASRAHETNLPFILEKAIVDSGLPNGYADLSAVAVTHGPGLALCLNIGVESAKEISKKYDLPLLAMNHLEAHALVPRMLDPSLEFPFLVLLVSGGHCMLVLAKDIGDYQELGSTLDDSLGESYDKVARMLGLLDYPENTNVHGGVLIEQLAKNGDSHSYMFPEPMLQRNDCNFSFSGLKTAVMYSLRGKVEKLDKMDQENIAASFQRVAIDHLVRRTKRAITISQEICCQDMANHPLKHLVVCGGVAANAYVREKMIQVGSKYGLQTIFPPTRYCTDNAVMIAWAGMEHFLRGKRDDPLKVKLHARLPLSKSPII